MFSLDLSEEQSHILRNLCQGVFHPVTNYMDEETISSVAARMRLTDGSIFPMPVFLDVPSEFAVKIEIGSVVNLRHKHTKLAELKVNDKFKLDKANLVYQLFGTDSLEHPGVKKFFGLGDFAIEGSLSFMLEQEEHFHTPKNVREHIKRMGWSVVTGFQTRNVPHRAHEHLIRIALEISDSVLIQPVIGLRKEGDFSSNAIIRGYEVLISEFLPSKRIMLIPIKIPMWFAGPREALLHAIIRKNFGCSHFIVGRDQAGVGNWYGKYDAQDLAIKHEKELQIKILPLREPFYCSICGSMASESSCPMNHQTGGGRHEISGTWLRKTIRNSERIDNRLVRPQVIDEVLKLGDIFD